MFPLKLVPHLHDILQTFDKRQLCFHHIKLCKVPPTLRIVSTKRWPKGVHLSKCSVVRKESPSEVLQKPPALGSESGG